MTTSMQIWENEKSGNGWAIVRKIYEDTQNLKIEKG